MADLRKQITDLTKQAKKRNADVVKEVQQLRRQIAAAAKATKRPAGQSPSDGAPSVRSKVLPGAEVATGDPAVALPSASDVNTATGALTAPDIHAAAGLRVAPGAPHGLPAAAGLPVAPGAPHGLPAAAYLPVAPGAPHGLPAAAYLPAAPLTSAATGAPTGIWVDATTGLPTAATWVPAATGLPAAAHWVPAATGLPTVTDTLAPPITSQAMHHSLVAPARDAAAVPHGWYPVAAPGGYTVTGSTYAYGAAPAHPQASLQVGVSHQPAYPFQAYGRETEGQLRGQIQMLHEMLGYEQARQARRFYRP